MIIIQFKEEIQRQNEKLVKEQSKQLKVYAIPVPTCHVFATVQSNSHATNDVIQELGQHLESEIATIKERLDNCEREVNLKLYNYVQPQQVTLNRSKDRRVAINFRITESTKFNC